MESQPKILISGIIRKTFTHALQKDSDLTAPKNTQCLTFRQAFSECRVDALCSSRQFFMSGRFLGLTSTKQRMKCLA